MKIKKGETHGANVPLYSLRIVEDFAKNLLNSFYKVRK